MARFFFGMNQSLDGFVDHDRLPFALRGPKLIAGSSTRHRTSPAASMVAASRTMRILDADQPGGKARLCIGVAQEPEMGGLADFEDGRGQRKTARRRYRSRNSPAQGRTGGRGGSSAAVIMGYNRIIEALEIHAFERGHQLPETHHRECAALVTCFMSEAEAMRVSNLEVTAAHQGRYMNCFGVSRSLGALPFFQSLFLG